MSRSLCFGTPDVRDALGQGLKVYVRRNALLALAWAPSARRSHGEMLVVLDIEVDSSAMG